MTAYFSATIGDRIEILSDSALYDSDGVMRANKVKVDPIGAFPAAMMTRGLVGPGDELTQEIEWMFDRAATFDEAIEMLRQRLQAKDLLAGKFIEAVIWGMSETTTGPQTFVFSTQDWNGRRSAYELDEVRAVSVGEPMPLDRVEQMLATGQRGTIRDKAVPIMSALRQRRGSNHTWGESELSFAAVGGHIDFTTVSAAGVNTTRIHTFPDRIGEVVGSRDGQTPTVVVPQVAAAPMSRQQRRAAERAARKAAA